MVTQQIIREDQSTPRKQEKQSFENLLGISRDSLKIKPPLYVSSIFGHPWSWVPPHRTFSEFSILDIWRIMRTFKYLVNVSIPSLPLTPPPFNPPILNDLFWEPTLILQRPDHNGSYTSYPSEAWYFMNGIMTNDSVAQINAAFISYLFHRPVTIIQNSTNSMVVDLLQCALGKEWAHTVEPAIKAFAVIYDALKSEKQKVIIIAHSQGTLIAAKVLELLNAICVPKEEPAPVAAEVAAPAKGISFFAPEEGVMPAPPEFIYPEQSMIKLVDFEPLTQDELAKLEIYCFANCANTMRYFKAPAPGSSPVPWIENFGNQYDIVARLGMLAPQAEKWGIQLDGPCYEHVGAWGHLLNEHYLFAIEDYQKAGRRRGGAGGLAPFRLVNADQFDHRLPPRLFSYINGGSPKL